MVAWRVGRSRGNIARMAKRNHRAAAIAWREVCIWRRSREAVQLMACCAISGETSTWRAHICAAAGRQRKLNGVMARHLVAWRRRRHEAFGAYAKMRGNHLAAGMEMRNINGIYRGMAVWPV